jgi:DNA-binding response OmpR family regulator
MTERNRILIADDEETFLEAHADLLRDEGYDCDCAKDAASAKVMLRQNRYDLLIADIKMPGNEELAFVEALPAIAEGLPVILVTGYPTLNTAIKSTRLAVAGYMLKPLPIDDFLKLVRQSIIRHETYRMFEESRNRLRTLQIELGAFENLKKPAPANSPRIDAEVFLHYTIKNILASLVDLKDLAQALAQNKPKQQVCQLFNCPRHAELTEAIRGAVVVMEKTKTSFKSKELAALRVNLENVLKQND